MASDKTAWSKAAAGIFRGTLAGALEGEEAFPAMELEELTVRWSWVPKFLEDGTVLADTQEAKTEACATEAVYKRKRTPTLDE